jgi:hypothetical protein
MAGIGAAEAAALSNWASLWGMEVDEEAAGAAEDTDGISSVLDLVEREVGLRWVTKRWTR